MRAAVHKILPIAALGLSICPATAFAQTPPSFTSATRYDAAGQVTGMIAPDPDGVGGNPRPAVRNTYDAAGNLTKVETGGLSDWQDESIAPASWSGFSIYTVVEATYDGMGRKLSQTTKDAGLVARAVTQFSYDSLGRLECQAVRMNPAAFGSLPASACTLGAEGTQGPDRITRNFYDAAGQLIKVQQGVGTSVQIDYVRYEYTANGKRKAVIDANGNRAEMTYDGHDRQTRWTFPSKATVGVLDASDYEEYAYDANGNRTSLRKRDGQTIGYSYDALNRVMVKDLPGADDVYYAYDLGGLQLEARIGSLTGMGLSNTYDGFGRLKSSTTAYGTPRTLEYDWDPNGNRTSIKHPDGVVFTYHYDGLDRLVGVKEHGTTEVVSLSYDAQGRRLGSTRSGVVTSYGYDGLSRLASLTDDLANSPNDVALTFGYNPASQIVTRGRDNDLYRFTGYVAVDRPYAANGLNQYTTAGSVAFCHDKNGNLTQDGTLAADGSLVPGTGSSYKYDLENRLIERRARVSSSCESIDYSGTLQAKLDYDASGRLRRTWDGSMVMVNGVTSVVRMIYDDDELVVEYNNLGEIVRRYVHGPGEDDPMLWYEGSTVSAVTRRSIQTDHQGSVVSIADNTGAMLAINAYDEYGIPKPGNLGRFQYTGQAWIPELGMYYYKARIYSPTLGRFLQVDPIGYDDQVNLYAYVRNDPLNSLDPTGKQTATAGARVKICAPASCARKMVVPLLKALVGAFTKRKPSGELLYRGLSNRDLESLRKAGAILPKNAASMATPDGHVLGADSKFVSLSRSKSTAEFYAGAGDDPSGYVATIDANLLPGYIDVGRGEQLRSDDAKGLAAEDQEVLTGFVPASSVMKIELLRPPKRERE